MDSLARRVQPNTAYRSAHRENKQIQHRQGYFLPILCVVTPV